MKSESWSLSKSQAGYLDAAAAAVQSAQQQFQLRCQVVIQEHAEKRGIDPKGLKAALRELPTGQLIFDVTIPEPEDKAADTEDGA